MTQASADGLSSHLATWGGVSRTADLDGPVHYVDFGGPEGAPRVVLVHGLGGSHLNWCLLAPRLVPHARVLAVDLIGFGLTHPEGRAATVSANTRLLHRFVREVAGAPAVLVGNSMGGMASILTAAARPDAVAGLVLVDPVVPMPRAQRPDRVVATAFMLYSVPWLGERYMAYLRRTLSARERVQRVLDVCCVDPTRIPEDLVEASVALVEHRATVPGLDAAFLAASRSMLRVSARRGRYWATMREIRCPVLLINGEQDRLVPVRSARVAAARNPDWQFEVFPQVGHVPQLERPDRVAELVLDWLARTGSGARAAERAGGG